MAETSVKETIKEVIKNSSHAYSYYQHHLIPKKYMRLGLVSFEIKSGMLIKLKDSDRGKYYWHFHCGKLEREYCDFFLECTKKIINKYNLDFVVYNEYAFPSFLYQKGRNHAYNYKIICDNLAKIANNKEVLLFPGTLNVCDKNDDDYGFSQGLLFRPYEDYLKVKKHTFAKNIKTKKPIENFIREGYFRFNIFRTFIGNFAISICSDFINEDYNRFYKRDYICPDSSPETKDIYNGLSLLIAPARDKSRTVQRRSKAISQDYDYYVAYVDSLENFTGDENNSSNVFLGGKQISSLHEKKINQSEFNAYLKTYKIDFSEQQKLRFKKKKTKPIIMRRKNE